MNETENKGRAPDFSGDGVAVWVNVDKNNNKYLSVKVLGHYVNCFKVSQQKKEDKIIKEAGLEIHMNDLV
jgi:hypothetical protein